MKNERKQKLIKLGKETLADALLDLASHSDAADDLIERLLATPKENVQRFKKKLTSLKRSRRFIDWRGTSRFARELSMLQERPQVEEAVLAVCRREDFTVRRQPTDHAGGKWSLRYDSGLGQGGNLEVDLNFMFREPIFPVGNTFFMRNLDPFLRWETN